jgi:hypothetical protein
MMGIDAGTGDLIWLTEQCDVLVRWRRATADFPREHDRARHSYGRNRLADVCAPR